MSPEHYAAYAAARSAMAELARTSPTEVFDVCHELLLELDGLHPETAVTEIIPRTYPSREAAWHATTQTIEALAANGDDRLGLALLVESLEHARLTEHGLTSPGNDA